MQSRFLFSFLFFCATYTLANEDPLTSLKKGQPKDVREMIDRLVGCNHWSGEEPYDADRKREISSAMADLQCAKLAKDEAAALKRYANKPSAIKALQQARETTF